jgi:hypothetical protein
MPYAPQDTVAPQRHRYRAPGGGMVRLQRLPLVPRAALPTGLGACAPTPFPTSLSALDNACENL